MPNLKIYLDKSLSRDRQQSLANSLSEIRDLLISHLEVPVSACQLAVIEVAGLPDQPLANAELFIMPGEKRTKAARDALATALQTLIAPLLDTNVAVRIALLDPATYIALK